MILLLLCSSMSDIFYCYLILIWSSLVLLFGAGDLGENDTGKSRLLNCYCKICYFGIGLVSIYCLPTIRAGKIFFFWLLILLRIPSIFGYWLIRATANIGWWAWFFLKLKDWLYFAFWAFYFSFLLFLEGAILLSLLPLLMRS